jgi:hypothetical protein
MFFNISKTPNFDFPEHIEYAGYSIDLDPGWNIQIEHDSKIISKGLIESSCTIYCRNNKIEIHPGHRRTFPVFFDDDNISNLIRYNKEHTSREELVINNIKLHASEQSPKFKDLKLSSIELFDLLYDYLDVKISQFNSDDPIYVFPTGGVDTMIILSFMLKHKKKYKIVDAEYKAQDYFVCHNRSKLGKLWAYRNIIYWRDYHVLMSGSNGDEMMLRNPKDAYMLAKVHGENLLQLLEDQEFYHSSHFLKSKQQALYNEVNAMNNMTVESAKDFILERNYSDYQFWHLGNTLTWAPLNDLNVCNIMLNFSYSDLKGQLLDASISKRLIERNNPDLLKYVSQSKNNNSYGHLYKIFEGLETF